MSTFTTPLDVQYLDGRIWKLLTEFDFASETLERIIRVPAGFITDFASIPRIFWTLLPPTGIYGKAAVIHDDLYRFPNMVAPKVTRLQADNTLMEAMVCLGTSTWTRWIIYLGVRLGGGSSYKG